MDLPDTGEFPLIKLAKKLKEFFVVFQISRRKNSVFPLIKLAKKLKEGGKSYWAYRSHASFH